MIEVDLFGNERVVSKTEKAVALDLFDAAAEQRALETGRAKSQERTEIVAPAKVLIVDGRCACHHWTVGGTMFHFEHERG